MAANKRIGPNLRSPEQVALAQNYDALPWLSIQEAAILLGVSAPTVRRWIREHQLPVFDPEASHGQGATAQYIRIDRRELDGWMRR